MGKLTSSIEPAVWLFSFCASFVFVIDTSADVPGWLWFIVLGLSVMSGVGFVVSTRRLLWLVTGAHKYEFHLISGKIIIGDEIKLDPGREYVLLRNKEVDQWVKASNVKTVLVISNGMIKKEYIQKFMKGE